jgi:transcriptional regulator with XRE-family HTH domain
MIMEILRQYMDEHNLKNQDVADIIGTTARYVSKLRRGKRNPGKAMAIKISEAFNLPLILIISQPPHNDRQPERI